MLSSDPQRSAPGSPSRGLSIKIALLGLVVVAALAGLGFARWMKAGPRAAVAGDEVRATGLKMPNNLFRGWTKPDLAIVLTGSQHGYLLPCGCSRPQVGGLERRWNFVQMLREQGWPVVAVDVGDVPQVRGPVGLQNHQGLLKYEYAMKAMRMIGYSAVSFGEYEAGLPLLDSLAAYALNTSRPRVLGANLKERAQNYPREQGDDSMVGDWELVRPTGSKLKVGITAAAGPTIGERIRQRDSSVAFTPTKDAVDTALAAMQKAGVDLRILLYQGLPSAAQRGREAEAVVCAKAFPQFQVVLCVNDEDEPAGQPQRIGDTLLCGLGHKGKYVGVVGVWRTGLPERPFDLRYQLVSMSEAFLTPKELENDHPIANLMEQYTQQLKKEDYLAKYAETQMHPLQALPPIAGLKPGSTLPQFIGTEKCKRCHEAAYDVWKTSGHSHAYDTLVQSAKRPSLRQYDAECIVCHTVGFTYKSGFKNEKDTPHLKNVGCESCHGPGSIHAANPNNQDWRLRMNPWKPAPNENAKQKADRQLLIDQFCQKCHDIDNDVHWTHGGFEKKWPKVAHPTPTE